MSPISERNFAIRHGRRIQRACRTRGQIETATLKREPNDEKRNREETRARDEMSNSYVMPARDRYNELITRLRFLAGSMHRAEREEITDRERRTNRTLKCVIAHVYEGLENRLSAKERN
jgi:hypothetical protein